MVRAGTSKSGLHNKSAGCGAAEAYASGPGSEEEVKNSDIHISGAIWRFYRNSNFIRFPRKISSILPIATTWPFTQPELLHASDISHFVRIMTTYEITNKKNMNNIFVKNFVNRKLRYCNRKTATLCQWWANSGHEEQTQSE